MGDYTALIIPPFEVKPELAEALESSSAWHRFVYAYDPEIAWPSRIRNGQIPFGGASAYNEGQIDTACKQLGIEPRSCVLECWNTLEPTVDDASVVQIVCDLKNYSDEISFFLTEILPKFIMDEAITAYHMYEYDSTGEGFNDFSRTVVQREGVPKPQSRLAELADEMLAEVAALDNKTPLFFFEKALEGLRFGFPPEKVQVLVDKFKEDAGI